MNYAVQAFLTVCNAESENVDSAEALCCILNNSRPPAAVPLCSFRRAERKGNHHLTQPRPASVRFASGSILRRDLIEATRLTTGHFCGVRLHLGRHNSTQRTAGCVEQTEPRTCYGRAQAAFFAKQPTGGIISLPGLPSLARVPAGRIFFQGWLSSPLESRPGASPGVAAVRQMQQRMNPH